MALSAGWFQGSFLDFLGYFFSHLNGLPVGPLWFVLALLFFSVAYLGWRIYSKKPTKASSISSAIGLSSFALMLGVITFAVRIVVPQSWTFTLLNFQFPYFPQYIALFIVGLIAFRGNWLLTIPKNTGRLWLRISLVLLLLLPVLFIAGSATGDPRLIFWRIQLAGSNIRLLGTTLWRSGEYWLVRLVQGKNELPKQVH